MKKCRFFPDYILDKIISHCEKTLNIALKDIKKENLSDVEREKKNIFETYYKFIENTSCIKFIENAEIVLKESNIKENDEDLLTLIIIILKSFLERKNIINTCENYVNSDDIVNFVSDHYRFYIILLKKYKNKKNISSLSLQAIDLLVKKNIIIEKIINLTSNLNYKTIKYYSIPNLNYQKNLTELILFSYSDFKLIEFDSDYFITSGHFFKTFEIYKKNFYSNKSFKLNNISYIMNKINVKLYVDEDFQKSLKNILKTDKNKLISEIFLNTEKINKLFELKNWKSSTVEEISQLQSSNSKNLDQIIYDYFANFEFKDNFIYFPIFLDFRGRKYYNSRVGPTSSKILRLAFHYGWYNQSDFKEENNVYSKNYYEIIDFFCDTYGCLKEKKYYECYFWILIGIGKFYVNKKKYPIRVEEFLNLAIKNYNSSDNNLEVEDFLEIEHYKRIVKDINKNEIKKRTIIKDATASLNQIFMKKLGPLDQLSMNYVNLGDKWEWYDTYNVCKDLFYEYVKNNKNLNTEDLEQLLIRPLIKDPVMKIPYSAGNSLCWKNFLKIVKEKKINITLDKKTKKIMILFYNFIRKDMQELYLYNKSSTALVNKISEEFENLRKYILESETGDADISYYKMKKSSIDKKYKLNGENKRVTKLILVPSKALDVKEFNKAVGANIVHFFDAEEIRIIEQKLKKHLITIHDSYLIDFNSCSKLIEIKIDYYQKEINKITEKYTVNNIFIMI